MKRDGGAADVYLHIGLPKAGTSHVQRVLRLSREPLAERGVLVPGETRRSQMLAVWDLMGRRTRGAAQPEVPGSWRVLVESARSWPGSHVVISEEFLTNAGPRQARRAVQAFAPARVHVVVTTRYLGAVIGSAWQQQLAKGRTWTLEEYTAAVRDPEGGPATAGIAFWMHQDLVRVLDVWERSVPRERLHLVTVPPAGAPRSLLIERFAAATRIDPGVLRGAETAANPSVGAPEAEVLRRLNLGLGGRLNERQYIWAVDQGVRSALRTGSSSPRIRLAPGEFGWVNDRAREVVAEVGARGYRVFGDLTDLLPATEPDSPAQPHPVEESEVAAAAVTALVAITEKYADLRWRTRRQRPAQSVDPARLGSRLRAAVQDTRVAALRAADHNRWVRRAARAYLWRTSRRSTPAAPSPEKDPR